MKNRRPVVYTEISRHPFFKNSLLTSLFCRADKRKLSMEYNSYHHPDNSSESNNNVITLSIIMNWNGFSFVIMKKWCNQQKLSQGRCGAALGEYADTQLQAVWYAETTGCSPQWWMVACELKSQDILKIEVTILSVIFLLVNES